MIYRTMTLGCFYKMSSPLSAYLFKLSFAIAVNNFPKQQRSVPGLWFWGSALSPLFLYTGLMLLALKSFWILIYSLKYYHDHKLCYFFFTNNLRKCSWTNNLLICQVPFNVCPKISGRFSLNKIHRHTYDGKWTFPI